MKNETITQRILTPDEGMVLTNGNTFAHTAVVLPVDADASVWYEITEAEAQEIIARMEAESDV